jgi:hypothetical protein
MSATEQTTSDQNKPAVHLVIVTADRLLDVGQVSFKFMFTANLPEALMRKCMGRPWGVLFKNKDAGHYAFNVWESSRLIVGGGWTPHDDEAWRKQMAEALPSSTLLMSREVFEWFEANILKPYKIAYSHHNYPGILTTMGEALQKA